MYHSLTIVSSYIILRLVAGLFARFCSSECITLVPRIHAYFIVCSMRMYIIWLLCCVSRLSSMCPQRIVTAIAITWKNLYIRRRCNLRSWSTQSNGWMKKWWISWRLRCWWASPTRTPSRKILRNTSSWTWWKIFQYPSFAPRLLAPPGGSPSRVGSTTSTDHLVSSLIWFCDHTHQK